MWRAGTCLWALPVDRVIEVMRPLPLDLLEDAPPFVLGRSTIRGASTLIVDAAALSGGARGPCTRFVTLRLTEGRAALAVAEVIGVRTLDENPSGPAPRIESPEGGPLGSADAVFPALTDVLRHARRVGGANGLGASGACQA